MKLSVNKAELKNFKLKLKKIKGGLEQATKKTASLSASRLVRQISKKIDAISNIPEDETKKTISRKNVNGAVEIILKKVPRLGTRLFDPMQDEVGVSWQIDKGGKRLQLAHAFMGPNPNTSKVSWKGNAFIRSGKSRKPIKKVVTVSPLGVFLYHNLSDDVIADISKYYEETIAKQVQKVLNKA